MKENILKIINLKKSFGENLIFEGINLEVSKGECISIIGPSGCGKSTFLRCINLLETPTEGQVLIKDREITAKGAPIDDIRKQMGMVYQSFNLFSHKTVLENVMLAPMLINHLLEKEARELSLECLRQVGMRERADFMPSQLSGGQKQRAAIARCLAMKPELILFDEPTSALDPTMVDEVLSVIRRLVGSGITCIIVTHEMDFAKNISSRVIYMDDKGIYEVGTPAQIFEHPQREKTRKFIDRIRSLQWSIESRDFDLYELNRAAAEFYRKMYAAPKQIYRVQLVLEELLCQLLLPEIKEEKPEIKLTLEYSVREDLIQITADYGGEPVSYEELAAREKSDISLMMLGGICRKMEWRDNQVRISL